MHVFPTFAVGGAQLRFVAVANRFGAAYRHIVVALDGNDQCRERLSPGLDVVFPAIGSVKRDPIGNARRLRQVLRDLRPDVLVTSNWGSIEWALANLGGLVRHVHTEDGFGPEERRSQLPRRVWARRLLLRRSLVVLPSRTLWRIAAETWRLPRARLRYIPNGVDLRRFAPAAQPPAPADAARPKVVGTVAALRAEKNLGRLLRAFRLVADRLPSARLVIVGDGAERAGLERLAQDLGIAAATRFVGQADDTAPFYAGFDAFALSSDTEQMPLSVLEAMAAGLPVVATDVGDVRAMLAAENAPFVVAPDAAALAEALVVLLRDPDTSRAIGAANRRKAEQDYQQESMFRAYAAIFDGTGGGRPPSGGHATD